MADAITGSSGSRAYDNPATVIMRPGREDASVSFERSFIASYERLRRECECFPHPGVVIVAVDAHGGGFRGSLSVAADPTASRSVIVGRHSQADLFLDADPALSLRHLAVVVGPARRGEEVCLRLIDLRTSTGFEDEHGQRYESLTSTGSLFVRCANYVLFFLVTGTASRWPDDPRQGWRRFPDRVYVEAEPSNSSGPLPLGPDVTVAVHPRGTSLTIDSTIVRRLPGPVLGRRCMLVPDEDPMGTLLVTTQQGVQVLVVGRQALSRGVMLGRYARCDMSNRPELLVDDSVSRVHLLVLRLVDGLYAIDTASRHGTRASDEPTPIRMTPLRAGRVLVLGQGTARVSWKPA
ncbi:FHA domain-containing protein [Paraliomyxa miuraensis]|uniref:FHA domain-containing protein n=1 Tax=Paraliomyxa miuraensis TaxID=376150 RepID=UPI002259ACEA|nr:FHA domain-containing protein [Paraliomyxa miuraensis]MCX4242800.1 FHA domain-containing protein [Paraliomyxa miuraensis]